MMATISRYLIEKKIKIPKIPKSGNLISRNQYPICSSPQPQEELPSKILKQSRKAESGSSKVPAATSWLDPHPSQWLTDCSLLISSHNPGGC